MSGKKAFLGATISMWAMHVLTGIDLQEARAGRQHTFQNP